MSTLVQHVIKASRLKLKYMKKINILNIVKGVTLLLPIFLFSGVRVASACTPIYSTPQETFNKSDAVFLGRVVSVNRSEISADAWDVMGEVQVDKYWKGNVPRVVKIKSSGFYTCGAAFGENAKGSDYLIYATKSSQTSDIYTIAMLDMKLASTSLSEIQALGVGSTPTLGVTHPQFLRNLAIGSFGEDVASLQSWLEQKEFLVMPTGVSKGYFGNLTRNALAKYQSSVGIYPAVGYFGPITRMKINSSI